VLRCHIFALHDHKAVLNTTLHHDLQEPLLVYIHASHRFFMLLFGGGATNLLSPLNEWAGKWRFAELLAVPVAEARNTEVVCIEKGLLACHCQESVKTTLLRASRGCLGP